MEPTKKSDDLSFLIDGTIIDKATRIWSDAKIRSFVSRYRGRHTLKRISKDLNMRETALKGMLEKLKRAAKNGYMLDAYLKAGRPCRYGNKKLA